MTDEEKRAKDRAYRLANRDRIRLAKKRYRMAGRNLCEHIKDYHKANAARLRAMTPEDRRAVSCAASRAYQLANPDKVKAYRRAWYLKNYKSKPPKPKLTPEERSARIRQQARERYFRHRERYLAWAKAYRETHLEELRAKGREYGRLNRKSVPSRQGAVRREGRQKAYYADPEKYIEANRQQRTVAREAYRNVKRFLTDINRLDLMPKHIYQARRVMQSLEQLMKGTSL